MNIPEIIAEYKALIKKDKNADEIYKWEAVDHFQKHWDIDAEDFEKMIRKAFQKKENLLYQNSWGFIRRAVKHYPNKIKSMFKSLYNEGTDIKERFKSFQNKAEALLPDVKKAEGKVNLNHQQDERTLSVYLSFMYPEKYYLFKDSYYQIFCKKLNIETEKTGEKYFHFQKLADNFKAEYIRNDMELLSLHKEIFPGLKWDETNLIVQNILYRMLNQGGQSFNRRYWAGGHHWKLDNGKYENKLKKFIEEGVWILGWDSSEKEAKNYYINLQLVENGDLIVLKSYGGKHDLHIGAIGEIVDNSNKSEGKLKVKYLKIENLYKGKAPIGKNSGNWQLSFFEIKRHDIIEKFLNMETINVNEKFKKNPEFPLNQILYGPPGTGKTYKLKNKYFDLFTQTNVIKSKIEFINDTVKNLTWWEVLAFALFDIKGCKVPELVKHELIKAKIELTRSSRPNNTIWYYLQLHTSPDAEYVNVKNAQPPYLFKKSSDSSWEVIADVFENETDLKEIYDQYQNYEERTEVRENYKFITFHQSFSYEDFIEGIKPKLNDSDTETNLEYEIKDGVFKEIAKNAERNPDSDFCIFIDEINRGNISKIFGELI